MRRSCWRRSRARRSRYAGVARHCALARRGARRARDRAGRGRVVHAAERRRRRVASSLARCTAGYVVSPVSLLAQDALIEHTLAHSETRIVFAAPEFVARLDVDHRADRQPRHRAADVARRSRRCPRPARDAPPARSPPATPAMLMYTSGTTGKPKGALLSHGNLIHAGRVGQRRARAHAGDRVLSSLPLYHVNGQCIATIAPLVSGGSVVMPHRFSVSQWWPLVERYRPTWLNVVPTIIAYLINGPELSPAQAEACRGIRFARSASAPLPPEHHRAFEARFGISVLEAMGLTECASVAFANPLDPARAQDRLAGPCRSGWKRASSRRDGAVLRRRRARRDRASRRQRDARLSQGSRKRRRARCAPAAGSRPAISAIATPTASTSSPAA